MKSRRIAGLLAAFLIAGGASACSNSSKVGNDKTLAFKEKAGGRVGDVATTTTAAPAAATTAPPTTKAPPTTAKPAVTTAPPTTQAASAPVTIQITSQRYEPFAFSVKVGTTLKVVNNDSQPRTFTADGGQFDSGQLAPGATWTYQTAAAGKFNFHDETRPYVVGQMEVTA